MASAMEVKMGIYAKCKRGGCDRPRHYCSNCGDPELEPNLWPPSQGYCSWACLRADGGPEPPERTDEPQITTTTTNVQSRRSS